MDALILINFVDHPTCPFMLHLSIIKVFPHPNEMYDERHGEIGQANIIIL